MSRDEGGSHEALGERRQPARDGLHELEDQGPVLDLRADGAGAHDQRHERAHGSDHQRVQDLGGIRAATTDPDEDAEHDRQAGEEGDQDRPAAADQGPQRDFDDRAEGPHRRTR